jgi:hypothetical protein
MTLLSKALALLLAILWMPMISHCDLEHLPGMEFIACCDVPAPEPHSDDDCETDGCAIVESGHYKTEEQPVSIPSPSLNVPMLVSCLCVKAPLSISSAPDANAINGDPLQSRVFSLRLALPPRAPTGLA